MSIPPLEKNGRDAAQDRELRAMRERFRAAAEENAQEHKLILSQLSEVIAHDRVWKVIGAIATTVMVLLVSLLAYLVVRIETVGTKVEAHLQVSPEVHGALRHDVDENAARIKEIERRDRELSERVRK